MLRPALRPVCWLFIVAVVFLAGAAPATAQPRSLGAPYLVKAIGVPQYPGSPVLLTAVRDRLFFVADTTSGYQVWTSDGTADGTVQVKDIQPGLPDTLVAVNDTLFFQASQRDFGTDLWKSDGTEAGTVRVKDFEPGFADTADLTALTAVNGALYFLRKQVLWRSDGTDAGTVPLKEFPNITALVNLDGLLVFMANDGADGIELWRSDGTVTGTTRIVDLNPGPGNSICAATPSPANVDGTLFFAGNDGVHGCELWQTDSTAAGTKRLTDINPGAASSFGLAEAPMPLTAVGQQLFFYADDGTHGFEPWVYDRATSSARLVRDIVVGPGTSDAQYLQNLNGTLLFFARNDAGTLDLWRSDGSAAGTQPMRGTSSSGYAAITSKPAVLSADGEILFGADGGSGGIEPWTSDGTAAGTKRLKDIASGSASSRPLWFTVAGGHTFFSANDGTRGYELWAVTNTPAPAPLAITLAGNTAPSANTSATFTVQLGGAARVAAEPITYLWRASSLDPQQHSGSSNSDSATFTWPEGSVQYVTVTARQGGRLLGDATLTVRVQGPGGTPTLAILGSTEGTIGQALSFSTQLKGANITGPITYRWEASEQTPLNHTGSASDAATFAWVTGGSKQITVTASDSSGVLATSSVSVSIAGAVAPPGGQTIVWLPLVVRR